jgi:hypothetical protein
MVMTVSADGDDGVGVGGERGELVDRDQAGAVPGCLILERVDVRAA